MGNKKVASPKQAARLGVTTSKVQDHYTSFLRELQGMGRYHINPLLVFSVPRLIILVCWRIMS
ncbi:MAG: hypothetical protein PF495_03050 [Spirochaetales bacterium]|jgi:hypothetical protein|nr:hypothetical protein [Spirochaetales bacterium]